MLMFYWCFIDYWYLVIWLLIIDRVFYLVGGLEHLVILFPYIENVIIPTDFHIFQMGWNHQPGEFIEEIPKIWLTSLWNGLCFINPFDWQVNADFDFQSDPNVWDCVYNALLYW